MGALAPLALALALTLTLLALALTLLVFLLVVFWKRYMSLGSVIAGATFPVMVLLCQRLGWETWPGEARPWVLLAAVTLGLVIVVKHLGNLRRLAAGTEPRLGERREPASHGAANHGE
jgi:glycerol-3-phosphate acyltransferase PlsY